MKADRRRLLILTAAMGAGHDRVAAELARRLAAEGAEVEIVDVLQLFPLRLGALLRRWYRWMVTRAPWLYELVYRVFFVAERAPSASPLAVLAGPRLRRLVARRPPDEVVCAFHLAAQVTGRLRDRGGLEAPCTVLVTDFAVHRMWLHPGNDRYLCPNPAAIRLIGAATGRPVAYHAPVVRPEFRRAAADPAGTRAGLGLPPDARPVLVSGGSWGVGAVEQTARALIASGRYTPVVLCGRNEALRRRLAAAMGGGGVALGWRGDVPELMAAAYALVDNAAGLTSEEAFAAGLPVVSYRPIPGHGRAGALAMARLGVSLHARDAAELLAALDRLAAGVHRDRVTSRAAALFAAQPAEAAIMTPVPAAPRRRAGSGATWTTGSCRR